VYRLDKFQVNDSLSWSRPKIASLLTNKPPSFPTLINALFFNFMILK
jgi:hypothetical protein